MASHEGLRAKVRRLETELKEKNAVLESYGDHRNWVKSSDAREALGVPEADRSGRPIDDPVCCFVAARYPWEPALRALMKVGDS